MSQVVVRTRWKSLNALFLSVISFLFLMGVAAQALAGSATLAWDSVNDPSVRGYVLYYGPAAGNYPSKVDVGNVTTRTVANLTDGATYHFAVTAYDAAHTETGFSNDASTTLPAAAPVSNFTASTTSGVAPMALNFTSTSTGGISTYAWNFGDGTSSTAQAPSHVYSTPGSYTVSLTVTGASGSNTKTVPNYITVIASADTSAPTAPSTLAASASGTGIINLSWQASTDNVGVTGYRIERCQGAGCTAYAQIVTSTTTAFSDTGLAAGTSYSYRVRATDAAGNLSGYSNTATATTVASSPPSGTPSTATSLAATPNPSVMGAVATFTATVTGNAPSGAVMFNDNGAAIAGCGAVNLTGSGNGRTASCTTSALAAGSHPITAAYSGDATNAKSNSATLIQVVSASAYSINVALASNGGVATASSVNSAGYAVAAINDNKRSGAGWGNGGGWNDGTLSAFPDWVQINFNGQTTIDRVVVYTLQDNYPSPVEPTDSMTFTTYGVTSFEVQGWDGSSWVVLGNVSGNNLVKRPVAFAAYKTDRIRINVTGSKDARWTRITEIEAWTPGAAAGTNFASAANGGTASASSVYSSTYPVSSINDDRRAGSGWGNGGGWNDGTRGVLPDWVQINFNSQKSISKVVVYTVQDNYPSPIEPTDSMTFSLYGLTDFQVQGWNGSAWVALATVSGNTLVKRTLSFPPYTTDRIRIYITASRDQTWSRITEIEAWGT